MGKAENAVYQSIRTSLKSCVVKSYRFSKRQNFGLDQIECICRRKVQPFPKRQISDSPKLKEFADDSFKSDENGRKISKSVENTGKRRNRSLQAISPFPTLFSKDSKWRHVKTWACLGKD